MATDKWVAGKDTLDLMRDLIANHHPDLDPDEIAVVFVDKVFKSGGVESPGKASKAPDLVNILGTRKYQFVIYLVAPKWFQEFSEKQRAACLDHYLCACSTELNEKSGELKYSIRKPDFVYFKEELQRWGIWQSLDEEAEAAAVKIEDAVSDDSGDSPE